MHDPLKKADKFWKRKKGRKNTNVAGFNDFEQNISLLRKEIFAAQSKANTFRAKGSGNRRKNKRIVIFSFPSCA